PLAACGASLLAGTPQELLRQQLLKRASETSSSTCARVVTRGVPTGEGAPSPLGSSGRRPRHLCSLGHVFAEGRESEQVPPALSTPPRGATAWGPAPASACQKEELPTAATSPDAGGGRPPAGGRPGGCPS